MVQYRRVLLVESTWALGVPHSQTSRVVSLHSEISFQCNTYSTDLQESLLSQQLKSIRSTSQQTTMDPSEFAIIRAFPGNDKCVDCGELNPQWGSARFGVLFCLSCSGKHRYVVLILFLYNGSNGLE